MSVVQLEEDKEREREKREERRECRGSRGRESEVVKERRKVDMVE